MSDVLNIKSIGVTAEVNPLRAVKAGHEFDLLMPPPDFREQIVKRNATVSETIKEMIALIKRSQWQVKKIAPLLKGKTVKETCKNIWNHLYQHIKYKEDDEGEEQLRTPALSWYLRWIRGIDCDDFSIFASCILNVLGITNYLRIARFEGKDYFQHVYVVVPFNNELIYIDPVLDKFNEEKEPVETKNFKVMENQSVNGIDVSVLSGIDEGELDELAGILFGSDFEEIFTMEGTADEEKELRAIYNHLVRTREAVSKNPKLIHHAENPESFIKMIDYAIRYWNTDKRDEALQVLADNEEKFNSLNGFGDISEHETLELFYGTDGLGKLEALGKIKAKKKFFTAIKDAIKKTGEGIKKAAQGIVKYNPVSLSARTGILIAMKTNLFQIAEVLKWGYLTESEAREAGFDMEEWAKARAELIKAEKVFVNVLKGEASKFKDAILSGRAGGLSGISLGVAAATVAAGTTATASPFLAKIKASIAKIDFKKLLSKINPAKLFKRKKKAEKEQAAGEEKTSIPEHKTDEGKEENTSEGAEQKQDAATAKTTSTEQSKNDTSENTEQAAPPAPPSPTPDEKGFLEKMGDWIKDNKMLAVLIGGTIAGGIVLLASPKARKAVGLGGTKTKRRKKTKTANTPKMLMGVGKAKKSRGKKKKNKQGTKRNKPYKVVKF